MPSVLGVLTPHRGRPAHRACRRSAPRPGWRLSRAPGSPRPRPPGSSQVAPGPWLSARCPRGRPVGRGAQLSIPRATPPPPLQHEDSLPPPPLPPPPASQHDSHLPQLRLPIQNTPATPKPHRRPPCRAPKSPERGRTRALLAVSHVGSTARRVMVPAVTTCGRMAP